jgi:shikimate 5-dehydrogenase
VALTVIKCFIKEDSVIAFGHGGLANAVIEALAEQRQQGKLRVSHTLVLLEAASVRDLSHEDR